jgi:hypothetical protein
MDTKIKCAKAKYNMSKKTRAYDNKLDIEAGMLSNKTK